MDAHGLLDGGGAGAAPEADALDDDALLAELGGAATPTDDITRLRNVRSSDERKAVEEIATAKTCVDFATFKPLFDRVQADLAAGIRTTVPFGGDDVLPARFWRSLGTSMRK